MRRTLTMAALMLALSCPAFAGEMHTPVATPPPNGAQTAQAVADTQNDAPGGLAETVLSVLENLLALL